MFYIILLFFNFCSSTIAFDNLQTIKKMEPAVAGKGKQFTIADDKGPKDVLLRSKQGVFICSAYDEFNSLKNKIFGQATFLLQTKQSNLIIAASQYHMLVFDLKEGSVIYEGKFNYLYSVKVSPNEKYLQVLDKINMNQGTTKIYSLPSMKQVTEFKENQNSGYFNRQYYPLVQFTADDRNYFRYNSKVLQVYSNTHEKIRQIPTGPLQFFQVSKVSKENDYFIACVFLDKKDNKGKCQIFTNKSDQPIYNKTIKKAEEVKIKFNPTSNSFLMELQTYFDPTGKSYYGQYGIFLYSDTNNKISTVKTEKGPVHDYSWHKTGDKFIIISGFMPATATLISKDNQLMHQFGKKHRNIICWGNLGRFVCLAGFGNLNGEMQMWDLQTLKQIGFCKSNSASFCSWSLDDRKIMTNIVTPRLRVDNCFKIFSYTGTLLSKMPFDQTQLYESQWLKVPYEVEGNIRGVSPGRKIEIQPKKDQPKFSSFASSLSFATTSLGQKKKQDTNKPKLAPGQHPEDLYVQKKRKRRKNKEVGQLQAS